jgi:hypothetical protein
MSSARRAAIGGCSANAFSTNATNIQEDNEEVFGSQVKDFLNFYHLLICVVQFVMNCLHYIMCVVQFVIN